MAGLPLFDAPVEPGIDGLIYRPGFLSPDEEREVLEGIRALDFRPVVFRGVTARRRVVQLGVHYSFTSRALTDAAPFPAFLEAVRDRAATLAGLTPVALAEALVTEYQEGAGIGWHRDAPPFGVIVGISLLSVSRFRLRPRSGGASFTLLLEPRSVYVLDGPAREDWDHSIPAGRALRYSITFRTLRA
jgi:alkylated DNA repair dioxygenase AlkB